MSLDNIIPAKFKQNPKDLRSCRLILTIDLTLLVFATLFIPFYRWIGFEAGMWIMIYTWVCAAIFPALMYYSQNFALAGNFFCIQSWLVFSGLIIFSGGTDSPYFMWLLSIPPIAVFYMRTNFARFWLYLPVGTAIFIAISQFFGLEYVQNLGAEYRPLILIFNYLALLVLFVVVFNSFKEGFSRMNSKLAKANESLQKSNDELERFAYIASHDLKSPLRNVLSFMDLFLRRHGHEVEPENREYLDIARSNALHMKNLIEDILEYSQSSKCALREEEVDLNKMLKLICDQLRNDPAYSHSEITVWSMPKVMADSTRFHQLFQNLVENGLKYNQSEIPKVEVRYLSEEDHHCFIIEDNGIGIPEKFHQKIFQMFERLHSRDSYQGTGIGLAICLKNIQEYRGHIELTSREGEGTTFQIRFPKENLKEVKQVAVHSEVSTPA